MELYLIRHGETDWNISRRLQGGTDIPLNEKGRSLAAVTAARGFAGIRFTHAFTSPLSRARETAEIVLGDQKELLVEDARLSEISFGCCEGIPLAEREEKYPQLTDFFRAPERYLPPEGGESIESLLGRTGDFLRDLAGREELRDGVILISSHGAASRALLANVKHLPTSELWGPGVPKNCAVTKLAFSRESGYRVVWQDRTFA